MKTIQQPIPLNTAKPAPERLMKRGALATFRLVRALTNQAKEVPGVLSQALSDVRDAWEETSRPNA